MARDRIRCQHTHYISMLTGHAKQLLSVCLMAGLTACSSMPFNETLKRMNGTVPINGTVPVTAAMQQLIAVCKQSDVDTETATAVPEVVISNEALNTFIESYCDTNSTTKQLKLITTTKAQSTWSADYHIWFDSLTFHTENLRKQKITNYYSDSKAQKRQQQLLEVQKQLIELKQKLVDIEKQRLETSLSEGVDL